MGGFEWQAVEIAAEVFGIVDIEGWLHDLATIRNHGNKGE